MRIGYFLSCEEFGPAQLVQQAEWAERAGFEGLWISDHYHPWNDAQGQSAFVWSVIGALSQRTALPVTTAVTCPSVRIHPAILAQATATSAVLHSGRFTFGVGSGEALNEHILGDPWPPAEVRLDMLEEAIAVIRELWAGETVTHSGTYFEVQNARIYTLPQSPPPVYVSGFGPKAATLAGKVGDGFICTKPDAELIGTFRDAGGGNRPAQGGYKVCWGTDAAESRRTAHRLWANEQLPGELAQVLPSPKHFEQASALVTEEMVGEALVCGDDVDAHVEQFRSYRDAGYDEVYVNQIGPGQEGFFQFYAEQVLPQLRKL
jgi:G6PDH family F420-dependent oxidoreductase